ncbi:MAG TPA: 4'-phosphopantetheinyl transferase superfamily protein [Geobacteraceae bacterium]
MFTIEKRETVHREQDFLQDEFPSATIGRISLQRAGMTFQAGLCICRCRFASSHAVRAVLSKGELKHLDRLVFEQRRRSYAMGRYAAKKALSVLSDENPEDIHIEHGIFNNPIMRGVGQEIFDVSITHSSEFAAALVFPASHPMGIDIEPVDLTKTSVIESELTANELNLLRNFAHPAGYAERVTAAWTIKESLSKVLRTGLTVPFFIYELATMDESDSGYVSTFKHFGQYKGLTFVLGDHVCSITCPRKTECQLDVTSIRDRLAQERMFPGISTVRGNCY